MNNTHSQPNKVCRFRVKSVEFAYPSSQTARRFGYCQHGCWTVQVGWSGEPLEAITAHSEREAALQHAHTLDTAWDSSFAHIHPQDAARFAPFKFAPITSA